MRKTLWHLTIAAALFAPVACKKDDAGREADKAADKVKKTVDDLRDEQKDVQKTAEKRDTDVAKEQKDVTEKQSDVAKAQADFDRQKGVRINDLEMTYSSIAAEPKNLTTGATVLTEKARADLNDKIKTLQMRLDEARNAIDNLKSTTPADWNERDDKASDAIKRLEDARDDAKKALDKGERIRGS